MTQAVPGTSHGSARLGLTLRSVLLAPHDGFAGAFRTAERRAAADLRPAEGVAPYVLAGIGGAALMSLWLKIGALGGFREVCSSEQVGAFIAAALVLGALLGLVAQALWGVVGRAVLRGMHGDAERGSLRLVWGASAFPQVLVLALLLPLDLLIVGTDAYTTGSLADPLATAWAAFSIAIGISLAVWSLFLFVRGVEVAGGLTFWRAVVATT
ncbi:MAG: hypothetical protein KY391_07450, partial [Actinobacteria bacterium]|nr:hypothetical protein [Actinomycetota bacterium]